MAVPGGSSLLIHSSLRVSANSTRTLEGNWYRNWAVRTINRQPPPPRLLGTVLWGQTWGQGDWEGPGQHALVTLEKDQICWLHLACQVCSKHPLILSLQQCCEAGAITVPSLHRQKWRLWEGKPVTWVQGQSQNRIYVCLGPGWVVSA